eukprot:1270744-Lingulodinium_polyedra.AAC.1
MACLVQSYSIGGDMAWLVPSNSSGGEYGLACTILHVNLAYGLVVQSYSMGVAYGCACSILQHWGCVHGLALYNLTALWGELWPGLDNVTAWS